MSTPTQPEYEHPLDTLSRVKHALTGVRALAASGDMHGARRRLQGIRASLQQGEPSTLPFNEHQIAHELWTATVAELMTTCEAQDARLDALNFARDLARSDQTYQTHALRLARRYVLDGSRAHQIAALQNRVQAAQQGRGSLVLIEGVAGVGKSTLAQACADWARRHGVTTTTGRCYERGVIPPLTPWQEALHLLAQTDGTDLAHLPAPFGNQPPAESVDDLILRIGTHLHEQAAARPIVLLLDDLHWADQESLLLLEFVTRRLEHLPLLVLGAYRSDEVAENHPLAATVAALQRDRPSQVIRLSQFTRDDTVRFVESHLGQCEHELVDYLYERAEGHPLFLVELLDDLTEQNLLRRSAGGRWAPPDRNIPVPTLLRQIILQRVTRLGEQSKTLLDLAAVVGEVWPLAVVEAVLDWAEDDLLAVLERLLAARLIEPVDDRGERYRFSHGLIQEVLYGSQLPRRRRRLHARVADQLETEVKRRAPSGALTDDTRDGELAYHCFQAERWLEAFSYSRNAGAAAYRVNALHSVVHYYRQALAAAARYDGALPAETLLSLYEQLGDAHVLLSQKQDALATYQRMRDVAGSTEDRARVAHALFRLAEVQERAYEHEQSEATRQTALALATEANAPHLMMRYHFSLGHHYLVSGGIDRADHHLRQMEEYAQSEKDDRALMDARRYRAYLAIWQGRYRPALDLAQDVRQRARAAMNAPLELVAHWLHGYALTELGEYGRAREAFHAGLDLREAIGEHQFYVARIRNSLGYLHRELGDLDEATRWNRESLEVNRREATHGAIECACYSLLDLAANSLAAGRLDASVDYLQQFDAISDGNKYARYRALNRATLLHAELALAQGRYEPAFEHATRAMAMAEQETMRKNMTRSLLLQGGALLGLGRVEQAVASLRQSVALADRIEHAALRWQTRLWLADAYAQAGKPSSGLYQEAHGLTQEIAGKLHDPHLRTCFLAMPSVIDLTAKAANVSAQKAAPRAKPQRPAGLSRREIDVLRLVAAGCTDRQIGEQLHITERTVNTHVANILGKTNCQNRAAASAFAVQHGLV